MIKIKGKELAKLIDRSERYTRVLLYRKGIRLRQFDLEKVIDLIVKYRGSSDFRYKDRGGVGG